MASMVWRVARSALLSHVQSGRVYSHCMPMREAVNEYLGTKGQVTLALRRFAASSAESPTSAQLHPSTDGASLAGHVALVTGSTSGIGLGIAVSLAKRGCDIILHGLGDVEVITNARSSVEGYQVRSHYDDTDLCNPSSIQKMGAAISRIFPQGVDILVNNAGFQSVNGVTEFPPDVWQKMLDVHLTAPFLLMQQFLPGMVKKGWGRIINVSSIHGLVASPFKAAYVSAKHGVIGLTKVVALETARTGVTCNAVCPGWVETPLFIKQAEARSKEQSISYEDARCQMVSNHPTEEPVKVEDVGELVAFICSPAANQMTGSSLVIDGGWTAR